MRHEDIFQLRQFCDSWEQEAKFLADLADFTDGLNCGTCSEIVFIGRGNAGAEVVSPRLPLELFRAEVVGIIADIILKRGQVLAAAKPHPLGK